MFQQQRGPMDSHATLLPMATEWEVALRDYPRNVFDPGGEAEWGRGTPLNGLSRYVQPYRVLFLAVLIRNWVSIFGHFGFCALVLNSVCIFSRSYFFIKCDKTINKSPSQCL